MKLKEAFARKTYGPKPTKQSLLAALKNMTEAEAEILVNALENFTMQGEEGMFAEWDWENDEQYDAYIDQAAKLYKRVEHLT